MNPSFPLAPDAVVDLLRVCWCTSSDVPDTINLALLYSERRVLLGIRIDEPDIASHWVDLYTGRMVRNVTHWMPIVEPDTVLFSAETKTIAA
jgi:hypothetical protein